MTSLEKLGKQKISAEPGGYDLASWTKNLNSLLDDFEQRAGPSSFPPHYFLGRRQLTAAPFDSSSVNALDEEIAALRREAEALKQEEERERHQNEEKLLALESEKGRVKTDLETARNRALERSSSGSFLSSLFGRRGRSKSESEQNDTKELESRLLALETEENALRAKLSGGRSSPDEKGPTQGNRSGRLLEVEGKAAALTTEREERMQFSREREGLATELAALISRLPMGGVDLAQKGDSSGAQEMATEPGRPAEV